ncbi:hypothetical protein [Hydrogenobaculum acidophilum]
MEYPKAKFEELAKRIKSMAISPEIDIAICFPGIDETECEEKEEYPCVVISYLGDDGEGPSKKVVFNESYWNSSIDSLLGAIMHQVKSLMEELQSFEGE